jgi:hypothetical protein
MVAVVVAVRFQHFSGLSALCLSHFPASYIVCSKFLHLIAKEGNGAELVASWRQSTDVGGTPLGVERALSSTALRQNSPFLNETTCLKQVLGSILDL